MMYFNMVFSIAKLPHLKNNMLFNMMYKVTLNMCDIMKFVIG